MSVADRFNTLLGNIALTETQVNNGITSRESVCKSLNEAYYSSSSKTANSFMIGSWGKYTRVRPPRDVDVLFRLPDEVYWRFQGRSGNKQSQLLQEVRNVLLNSFPNTAIRGDGPVVMVPFSGFRVELLPAFLQADGKYRIGTTGDGGSYKTTDPTSEAEKIQVSNDATSNNTRHLIRMAKCWQGVCNVSIKSFWLELLATEFLLQWSYAGKSATYYDWMVRDFFKYMMNKKDSYLFAPGTYETQYLGDDWYYQAERAYKNAVNGCENEAGNYLYLALDDWQKIFGTYIQ